MKFISQLLLYMLRWQCSTPTLAIFSAGTVSFLTSKPLEWPTIYEWAGAFVANIVGSLIFFWVDRIIFKHNEHKNNN
jgi:hypothetical protein